MNRKYLGLILYLVALALILIIKPPTILHPVSIVGIALWAVGTILMGKPRRSRYYPHDLEKRIDVLEEELRQRSKQ